MNDYKTLPAWVTVWGTGGLDAARELLRRPDLAALGKQVGGVRVFDSEAADLIRLALGQRGRKSAGTA